MKSLSCPNRQGSLLGRADTGAIILQGFYKTSWENRHGEVTLDAGSTRHPEKTQDARIIQLSFHNRRLCYCGGCGFSSRFRCSS